MSEASVPSARSSRISREADVSPDVATHVDWYRRMLEIRLFEEKVQELFMEGLIQGTTHLCQGQEAVSVGAIARAAGRRLPDDHLPRPRPRAGARHARWRRASPS